MTRRLTLIALALLLALAPGAMGQTITYRQLTSIANIDESATYVLGVDGTGFHCDGTSGWGYVALPSEETPICYTLSKAQDGNSFTAQATIEGETLYLQIRNSNTFKMSASTTDTTALVLGVSGGDESVVAGVLFPSRRICYNQGLGLRTYNHGNVGPSAYFYKVVNTGGASTYAVNFNAAGGTFVGNSDFPNASNDKEAGTYALPSATRDGYTFNGWTTTVANSVPQLGSYTVSANVDLIASYTANNVVVTPPSIEAGDVDIAYNATSGTIAYTIEDEPDPVGSVTSVAVTSGNWLTVTDESPFTSPIAFSCTANSLSTARTATVLLTYTYGNSQTVTKNVTVTQAANANYTTVTTEAQLNTAIAATTTTFVCLGADITLTAYLQIGTNDVTRNVTLDLNGHTLQRNLSDINANGHVIEVFSKGTLTIIDGAGGGKLKGGRANNGGGICNYGTLHFQGGTITDCMANGDGSATGGGIKNGGTMTMSGGTILGCWGKDGGGIYNASGCSLTITGGTITGNTSNAGGGAIVNYGTATITGGTITGNHATTRGGGIWNGGTLTVGAATFDGNRADIEGGGIYLKQGCTATLNATAIRNNTSADAGGIYVDDGATANIAGITVRGNTSTLHGGGGISNHGTLNITSATIENNQCLTNGGGIWNGGFINMEGTVTVTGNSKLNGWTSNLFCTNGHVVTVTGDLGNSRISVSHEGNDGYITTGYKAHNETTLHFDNDFPEACNLGLINNEAKLTLRTDVIHYAERNWDGSKVVQTMKTQANGNTTTLSGTVNEYAYLSSGSWIVVKDNNVQRFKTNIVSGTVNMILCDGAKYTSPIILTSGSTLNIYGQRDNSGTIDGYIRVPQSATLNIHGGNISADGYGNSAGIGGEAEASCGNIAIYGGTVTAQGGEGGAGIGSGYEKDGGSTPGNIKIYGGSVTAEGGYSTVASGAGIGGGGQSSGETVTIYGGYVVARGGDDAAGIGSGEESTIGSNIDGGTITIYGGEVYAYGNDEGAGIGGGQIAALGIVNLYGGYIEATGGDNSNKAIGGHDETHGNKILNIGDHIKVEASDNSRTSTTTYSANNRSLGCGKKYAILTPCDHNGATYTGSGHCFSPNASCSYCSAPLFNVSGGSWHAIASPVVNTTDSKFNIQNSELTTATYDLLRYNEATATWENQKAGNGAAGFSTLERGRGYIYRRADNAVVGFSGYSNSGSITVSRTASCPDVSLRGFNLIGNPYPHAVSYASPYYELRPDGTWLAHASGTIAAGQAFLTSSAAGNYTFTDVTPDNSEFGNSKFEIRNSKFPFDHLTFSVTDGKNSDLAYVSLTLSPLTFQLKKIAHLDGEAPMLYIPQNDADYAACVVDKGIGQFQLHVKTKAPGQYTLDATGMLRGMQIIDLQTGMAVSTPYSFEAGGTSRFLVKLSPDVQKTETSVFAYVSGNHLIVEGTGLLQAYDILGRLLFSRNVNSQLSILNSQFPSAGVYILSLGEKTQKIVIR